MPRYQRVHVIINPASGNNEPILNTLNDIFREYGITWSVSITHDAGDAALQARAAHENGVDAVLAYGGDGTQLDAANGLIGTETPLGVLPGGTANALAAEMQIPLPLPQALRLICSDATSEHTIDVGMAGDRHFLLRVGTGMIAAFSEGATRELKDRFGLAAYIISGINALANPQYVTYTIQVDDETFTTEGAACLVTNANALGAFNMRLAKQIKVDDGLLDLFILNNDLQTILGMAGSIAHLDSVPVDVQHWQGREITIDADPPQGIFGDGETTPFTQTPTTMRLLPKSLRIIVHTTYSGLALGTNSDATTDETRRSD